MTTSFEEKLTNNIKKLSYKKILVAFSGGKDSTALLHCLNTKKLLYNFTLNAVHINHNLRTKALNDENFCIDFCKKYNIPLFIEQINVSDYVIKTGYSFEEASRILRYKKLYELLEKQDCDCLVVAHTKDDMIENFFIKVFQGTSIFHLKGFSNEYKIERPLLDINTNEVLEYLSEYKIDFAVDETNYDNRFLRNFIRNNLIPIINTKNNAFLHNILNLQIQSKKLCDYMKQKIHINIINNNGVSMIKISDFHILDLLEKEFILSNIFSKLFRIEKKHIDCAMNIINSKTSKRMNLPNNFILEKTYNYIYIYNKKELLPFFYIKKKGESSIYIKSLQKTVVFGDKLANECLIIRNRKEGDRLYNKKLKDIFIDKKIDLFLRDTAILIEKDNTIVWAQYVSEHNNKYNINIVNGCKNGNKLFVS